VAGRRSSTTGWLHLRAPRPDQRSPPAHAALPTLDDRSSPQPRRGALREPEDDPLARTRPRSSATRDAQAASLGPRRPPDRRARRRRSSCVGSPRPGPRAFVHTACCCSLALSPSAEVRMLGPSGLQRACLRAPSNGVAMVAWDRQRPCESGCLYRDGVLSGCTDGVLSCAERAPTARSARRTSLRRVRARLSPAGPDPTSASPTVALEVVQTCTSIDLHRRRLVGTRERVRRRVSTARTSATWSIRQRVRRSRVRRAH
jgi:hypothetical protein